MTMRRSIAAAVVTFATLMPLLARAQSAAPPTPPVIVTHGEATLKRAPDRAWITVSTETRERVAADARTRSAEAMTAVQQALRGAGVPADAIRTTGYSLNPEMEWNNGRGTVRGYVVRNSLEVRVDNLDKLSDVIDAANSSKSTAISISGPRFDLKNTQEAEAEALRTAVQSAMARARAIAAGAGRTLGAIVRVDDQNVSSQPPTPMPYAMRTVAGAAEATPTPITPGEIEVRALVMVTFELR